MLDGLKFSAATLGNIEVENRRPEIGVDCILVTLSPKSKTPLRLGNDPICMLASNLVIGIVVGNMLFMTRIARHPDEQLSKLSGKEVFSLLKFPSNFLCSWSCKLQGEILQRTSN